VSPPHQLPKATLTLVKARLFRFIFYLSSSFVVLDFILNLVWLPIGTANTYGFRTAHEAFMTTYNGTGAPPAWNWCLSYLATAGILIGFDASGHVAEETKNASVNAAKGIFWSTVVSGIGGFLTIILFLFCVVRILPCVQLNAMLKFVAWPGCSLFFRLASTIRPSLRSHSWKGGSCIHEHHLYHCSVVCTCLQNYIYFLANFL